MTLTQQPNHAQTEMSIENLKNALSSLPPGAPEALVSDSFVKPLLEALGFGKAECYPEYGTDGRDAVDFAARKNKPDDLFHHTKSAPFLLVEVKGQNINLSEGSPSHQATQRQIERYLLSSTCKTAKWGIITNSTYIQLFCRHGKVVFPATVNLQIKLDNIAEIISELRHKIDNTHRALSVCVYNNKGGVGKTTTLINLAGTLYKRGKKVLIVDFDSQSDTTLSLKLSPAKVCLSECLKDTRLDIRNAIVPFSLTAKGKLIHVFDVIPADSKLEDYTHYENAQKIQRGISRLRDLLKIFLNEYDYILIDCPTQWLFFSQSGVYASDVVLIPTKHNGLTSLYNAAKVVEKLIPEIRQVRKDGAPKALPIFFNGEKINDAARHMVNSEIGKIIECNKNLLPYFYPKYRRGTADKTIFEIPAYASVANAAFSHVPAVFMNKTVLDHYDRLAKEYFLHG
ncbi:MAG: AAA family ATPase [Pegethrix bostrychoides GSE-TBD4-15B]|jgi:cellulose biosynthesis protein BcsQ|uniref:AAA family ATPase n=1 Tax=Pegethrix bostrychoides GSE-TBD4-15B TaxID=2839662 RepID=A0A951PD60_9CYAN|nr:AAA family ATPase [Pegethrix bostrychoides GSE-TBD4-15B]